MGKLKMNKKQKIVIVVLLIFTLGMIIGAADAASHSVKKGKYKVKLTAKEYKKLTATETKYKTVNKTKTVTKNVTKYNKIPNYTYIYEPEDKSRYYVWSYHNFTSNESYKVGDKYDYEYIISEVIDNSVYEPYVEEVTEKVTEKVKVPYKVRKKAQITKKIKGKYRTYKKPIYKTIKVKKTGYKVKYVKSSLTIYRKDGSLSRHTEYAVTKPKGYTFAGIYNDWVSDREVHTYLRYNKKVTYYEKKKVKKGYKKVKTPLKMTIKSYKGLNKGKVYVDIWSKAGHESKGYAKIK